jgi:pyruvate dehydrogenase E2 component (dihydrolipoamide acetyltransferase)
MARPILMPKPGQMTEECTLTLWCKQVGDPVHKGDVLFEIETDKSTMEVETFEEGVLLAQVVAEGETAAVNSVCGWVGEPGEAVPATPATTPTSAIAAAPTAAAPTAAAAAPVPPASPAAQAPHQPAAPSAGGPDLEIRISPRARALASTSGVDPSDVRGTGPGGRIVERDVVAAAAARASRPAPSVLAAARASCHGCAA